MQMSFIDSYPAPPECAIFLDLVARIFLPWSLEPDYYSKQHQDDYGPQNLQTFPVRKVCISGADHDGS